VRSCWTQRVLANDVRFGCEVVDVSSHEDHAEVRLSDGSLIRADLLVAADGAKSTLRKRLLPGHEPEPLQTVAIYGRSPLDTSALTWLPRGVVEQRFVGVTDGAGTTLALGAWYPRRVPAEAASGTCAWPETACTRAIRDVGSALPGEYGAPARVRP
jgi:2-polyprenyl-6-methoxyphenol hydroxylase-like FAD-dependent oxidoreductase